MKNITNEHIINAARANGEFVLRQDWQCVDKRSLAKAIVYFHYNMYYLIEYGDNGRGGAKINNAQASISMTEVLKELAQIRAKHAPKPTKKVVWERKNHPTRLQRWKKQAEI